MARVRGIVYRIFQAGRGFRIQEALAAIVLIQCRIAAAVVTQMNGTVTAEEKKEIVEILSSLKF